ncbi:MAG: EAL domain-containing response regulator [Endozoicomonas sp.]
MNEHLAGLKVLIVEDHQFQRMVAEQTVTGLGVETLHTAGDGDEAMELLRNEQAMDVVICDLDMPKMDGITFIRHLAEEKLASSVIVASALDPSLVRTVEDMAQEHGLLVLGTLPKPLSRDRLRQLLELYFGDDPELAPKNKVQEIQFNREDLKEGIENDQFILHYQPKVLLQSGRLIATEALCRWLHPEAGLISPAHFIPLMESSGLVTDLTYKLIDQALKHLIHWSDEGRAIGVSVNLSAVMLSDTSLPDRLYDRVRNMDIEPELLTLEITESSLIQNAAKALETLARLKMKGFSLSIDDFGTGYSSMQQLNRIPFSELKIDRSFVKGANLDETRRAIVQANIGLAHNLKMSTVAEGVENIDEWLLLSDLNCDMAQGFLIARPMPGEDLIEWEKAWLSRLPLGR